VEQLEQMLPVKNDCRTTHEVNPGVSLPACHPSSREAMVARLAMGRARDAYEWPYRMQIGGDRNGGAIGSGRSHSSVRICHRQLSVFGRSWIEP